MRVMRVGGAGRPRAASAGTSVTATTSEATIEAEMVKISSRNSSPTSPLMNRNGNTAARLVLVAAMIGLFTSAAAFSAASTGASPSRWWRSMFSSITMVLSTSIPMPSARPPSVIRFNDSPPSAMMEKAIMIEIGIALPMMSVPRTLPRNTYTTSIASSAPARAANEALSIDWRTYTAWFDTVSTLTSAGTAPRWCNSARRALTPSATSTVLAVGCFCTDTRTPSVPL